MEIEWIEHSNADYRTNFFGVHISHLPSTVTMTALKNLFMKAGDVEQVYIPPHILKTSKFTFAFVRYQTIEEAEKACKMFNKTMMNGNYVEVTLSKETRQKIGGHVTSSKNVSPPKSNGILRERFDRMEVGSRFHTKTKEKDIHSILKSSMNNLQNFNDPLTKWLDIKNKNELECFMKDFKEVLVNMVKVPDEVPHKAIKHEADSLTKKDIESLVLRYHNIDKDNFLLDSIDIDLCSGDDKIDKSDYDYYFNVFKDHLGTDMPGSDEVLQKNISICNYQSLHGVRLKQSP